MSTNFKIIQKRKIWLGISIASFLIFGTALIVWGFKFGIDFTGGSLLEVKFSQKVPTVADVEKNVSDLKLNSLSVQPSGSNSIIMRFQQTENTIKQPILDRLQKLGISLDKNNQIEELNFNAVGPSIGQELKKKSVYSIFFVFVAIILYITWAFRKVSKPVASYKYGFAAILAMFHDVILTMGIFAVLGKFYGIEINTPFVAAVLTVVGYSVHDTIVVFDRIRENLPRSNEDFEGTVNNSLNQTLVRSINTSLTVVLTLVAIIIFGGESIRTFALALAIGIFVGTYSSIFIASPLLVVWEQWGKRKESDR